MSRRGRGLPESLAIQYGGRGTSRALPTEFLTPRHVGFSFHPAPSRSVWHVRTDAPRSRQRGTEARIHPRSCGGEHVWCEAFSSPGPARTSPACTRAVRDGDNVGPRRAEGVDVWRAARRLRPPGLARTDPDRPKRPGHHDAHRDMRDRRDLGAPASTDDRRRNFNEVLLGRGPRSRRNAVGDTNGGWRVARTMLAFGTAGAQWHGIGRRRERRFNALVALAQARHLTSHPGCANSSPTCVFVKWSCGTWPSSRRPSGRSGTSMGARPPCSSWPWRASWQDTADVAAGLAAWVRRHGCVRHPGRTLVCPAAERAVGTIGGGTNEIVRNVIAEQVLACRAKEEGDIVVPFRQTRDRHAPEAPLDGLRVIGEIGPVRRGALCRHALRRSGCGGAQDRAAAWRSLPPGARTVCRVTTVQEIACELDLASTEGAAGARRSSMAPRSSRRNLRPGAMNAWDLDHVLRTRHPGW